DDRSLDDLVLQRRHTDWSLSTIRLRDVDAPYGLRPVRSALKPSSEVDEISLERVAVVLPCRAVDPWARVPLDSEVRGPKAIDVADMVEERREPLFPVLSRSSTHSLESAARVYPALCPERVALGRVSLGQVPSLHLLRSRSPGVVRRLRRYYGPVRLPTLVRHR